MSRWSLAIAALCCALVMQTPAQAVRSAAPAASSDALGLVPEPQRITLNGTSYTVPKTVQIAAESPDERSIAALLAEFLRTRGVTAAIVGVQSPAQIRVSARGSGTELGTEGYDLTVDANGATLTANDGAGLFYALQTLEQLFPVRVAYGNTLTGVAIVDTPAYPWRGLHLDVSRHFFPVPVVKRYIDLAAHYKFNTFHWHLTDDQGWRIAINRYPRLTAIGSCRAGTQIGHDPSRTDGKPVCGYYTQDEIRDVVTYAKQRYVTIVPEIEMPGHSVAALTAYPWLACQPAPFRVRETWGVSHDIACPTERTFRFYENVLDEVMALFPGRYIHIGGDEVPKDAWRRSSFVHDLMKREHLATYEAVQGYFTRRIERYLVAHGRSMIGWDEILDGGVSESATVMSWRGTTGGTIAATRGNDVVMSPDGPLYLDWAQGDPVYEPLSIGGLATPQMIYDFDPTPSTLSPAQARHILGVQGNLWTEYIPTADQLFSMLLPRALAVAEDGWTRASDKRWSSFVERSRKQYLWLESEGIPFRIPDPTMRLAGADDVLFESVHRSVNETELRTTALRGTIAIADDVPDATIFYTTDGSLPSVNSARYVAALPFDLDQTPLVRIRAVAALANGRLSAPTTLTLRR